VVDVATVDVDEVVGGSVVVVVVVVVVEVVVVVDVDDVDANRVNSVVEAVSSSEPPHAVRLSPPTTTRARVRRIMIDIMSESARDSVDPAVTNPSDRSRTPVR
jgi:hypothetical protein